MFCTNCGNNIPENAKFCANCGTPVGDGIKKVDMQGVYADNMPKQAKDTNGVYVRGAGMVYSTDSAAKEVKSTEPSTMERFIAWVKEDWLMKLGALLLLLAMGWFAQYAFAHEWIGKVGRISIGLIIGIAVLAGGYFRSIKYKHQGGVLLALGAAIVLSVMFAAREVYDMFTPLSSLFIMFGTTAFTMVASARFNNKALAVGSVALAALVPLLTNSTDPTFIGLFSYLGVVTVASLALVFYTGWRELILENFVIIGLFSLPYLDSYTQTGQEVYIAYIFALLFFITSVVGIVKSEAISKADMITAFGTGMFLFAWTLSGIAEELQTIMLLGWALVFAIGSFLTYSASKKVAPFVLYGGVAAALIAFATAVEFSGVALMMAYTAEVTIAVIVSAALTHSRSMANYTALLFAAPILMSFEYLFSGQWSSSIIFEGALAIYFLMFALVVTAIFIIMYLPLPQDSEPDAVTMPLGLLIIFAVYFFLLIWIIPHALFTASVGTTIALLIYTTIGLTLYITANGKYEHTMHRLGQILLAGVVVRLLLIDVWNLDLTGRIVTFALVGVALIVTAFVRRGK